VVDETADVLILNVADVEPAFTTIVPDGEARFGLALKFTVIPPVGAFPVNVTVPETVVPPFAVVGETVKALTSGGRTWSCLLRLEDPWLAVIVTNTVAATGFVATENVTPVEPAAIVTEVGTLAAAVLLLESETT